MLQVPALPTRKKVRCAFSLEDRATNNVETLYPEPDQLMRPRDVVFRRCYIASTNHKDKVLIAWHLPSTCSRKLNLFILCINVLYYTRPSIKIAQIRLDRHASRKWRLGRNVTRIRMSQRHSHAACRESRRADSARWPFPFLGIARSPFTFLLLAISAGRTTHRRDRRIRTVRS